jgi:post-segregation antitoxin (ccd killing protein)
MRTTVTIDDDLLREAKRRAAERNATLSAVIEESLRAHLAARPTTERPRIELPVATGNGVLPGVDLTDNAGLLAIMDGLA